MADDEIGTTDDTGENVQEEIADVVVDGALTEEEEDSILIGAGARESLASLGLPPEESQKVPDYDGTIKIFNEGDLVQGIVVRVDKEEVLLDIGYKSEGVIPSRELSIRHDVKPADLVSPGDEIEALVLQKEDKEGRLILSKKRALYERAWGDIERIKNEDGIVEGDVIEVVKGGLILDIGLRGFLPASLVDMRRVKDLNQFIGQKIEAKIIELDKNRNNVVLSRRAYLESQKSTERKEFLEGLVKGLRQTGTVSSIVSFGAFVDLGSVDGLIHISELSWSHVDHPSEVLAVGDQVTVEILDVDLERERVSLSLKKAQEDPWETLSRQNPAGSTVSGKVTKIVPFGAFVEIAPGVEGLVHISELAWNHIEIPEEVISVGDVVDAKIIEIDLGRRRISLSVKQLSAPGDVEYSYEDFDDGKPEMVDAVELEQRIFDAAELEKQPAATQAGVVDIESEVTQITTDIEHAEACVIDDEHENLEEADLEGEGEGETPAKNAPVTAPAEEDVVDASDVTEAAVSSETEESVDANNPSENDGSLESILADMKRKSDEE